MVDAMWSTIWLGALLGMLLGALYMHDRKYSDTSIIMTVLFGAALQVIVLLFAVVMRGTP